MLKKGILICGKTAAVCESIAALFTEFTGKSVALTDCAKMRAIDTSAFDVVIISTPLDGEYGVDLAADLRRKSKVGLVVVTKIEIADDVQRKLKFTGALVVGRPLNKSALLQAVKFAVITSENTSRLYEEVETLNKKLDDVKVIDRAERCLISTLSLTEEQAHRQIQKMAMDTKRTLRLVAEEVLRTYNNTSSI